MARPVEVLVDIYGRVDGGADLIVQLRGIKDPERAEIIATHIEHLLLEKFSTDGTQQTWKKRGVV